MQMLINNYLNLKNSYGIMNKKKPSCFLHYGISRPSCDCVTFSGSCSMPPKYILFDEILNKIIGNITQEDYKNITSQTKKLKAFSKNELMDIFKTKNKEIHSILEKTGIKDVSIKSEKKYLSDVGNLSLKDKNRIKTLHLNILAIREKFAKLDNTDKLLTNPTIKEWFPTCSYNGNSKNYFSSLFVHPIDKVEYLVGNLLKSENQDIIKATKKNKYKKLSIKDVQFLKIKVLEDINNTLLKSAKYRTTGILSEKEKCFLRKKLITYKIYQNLFDSTKNLESLIINSNKKLSNAKVGDYIEDLGLLVDKSSQYDKENRTKVPCLMFFNKEKNDFGFKLIKLDAESETKAKILSSKMKELKLLPENRFKVEIKKLEEFASTIIDKEKDNNLAQINFNLVPTQNIKGYIKNTPPERVDTLINSFLDKGVNKVAIVRSFVNNNPHRFYEAGRKVGLPLIQLLNIHKCNDIILEASPIGKSKSPLPIYLRAGFKPISHTMDEIKSQFDKKIYWDPKVSVFMYLPQNALLNNIALKEGTLNEIFAK